MRLGLFDSGIGGLTVLQAIRSAFPTLDVYIWATPRVFPMALICAVD